VATQDGAEDGAAGMAEGDHVGRGVHDEAEDVLGGEAKEERHGGVVEDVDDVQLEG